MYSSAFSGYYFGTAAAPGRVIVVICILEAMSFAGSLLVQFLFLRTMAQKNARSRFWYIATCGNIAVSILGFALAAYVAAEFNASHFHAVPCNAFSRATQELCVANYAACALRSAVVVIDGNITGPILIAIAVIGAANMFASVIPPNWGLTTTRVNPARPDTMIFRPATYAPDGLTEDDALRLQSHIRLEMRKTEGTSSDLLVRTDSARQSVSARRQSARKSPRLGAIVGAALFISQLKNRLQKTAQAQLRYAALQVPAEQTELPPVLEGQIATIASRVTDVARRVEPPSAHQAPVHCTSDPVQERVIAEVASRIVHLKH